MMKEETWGISTDRARTFFREQEDVREENRNLFHFGILTSAALFRDMESDFGILPMPKFDEAQEEYVLDYAQGSVLWAVPVTASDYDLTAKFCEIFGHYSQEYIVPAYYETTLQDKFSRDADTREMLTIIRNSIRMTLDGYFSYCFTPTPITTFSRTINLDTPPASFIASNQSAWDATMKDVVEAYK